MLIKCPECNKEISDKSKVCIYCGCPFDQDDNTIKLKVQELSKQPCSICGNKEYEYDKDWGMLTCTQCGCGITIDEDAYDRQMDKRDSKPKNKCPKCGCTEFTPVRKKFSLLTGFATNKVELVCNNCGYRKK